nr:hypothetical protein Itr_chr12CG14740 [Ipomoea trifida]
MYQGRKSSPVEKEGEEESPATAQRRQTCSLRRSSPQQLRSGSIDANRRSCFALFWHRICQSVCSSSSPTPKLHRKTLTCPPARLCNAHQHNPTSRSSH